MNVEFVDSNVLVYAHDRSAGAKRRIARDLLLRLVDRHALALSIQVLAEFYVVTTGKIPKPISPADAIEVIEDLGAFTVFRPAVEDLVAAASLAARHKIHFWDAMIIRGAQATGAATLWSEDLSSGQVYGTVTVRNPFAERGTEP